MPVPVQEKIFRRRRKAIVSNTISATCDFTFSNLHEYTAEFRLARPSYYSLQISFIHVLLNVNGKLWNIAITREHLIPIFISEAYIASYVKKTYSNVCQKLWVFSGYSSPGNVYRVVTL